MNTVKCWVFKTKFSLLLSSIASQIMYLNKVERMEGVLVEYKKKNNNGWMANCKIFVSTFQTCVETKSDGSKNFLRPEENKLLF